MRGRRVRLLAVLAVLAACGEIPRQAVVLVADDQGGVGRAEVATAAGRVAIGQANAVVGIGDRGRAPDAPRVVDEAAIRATFAGALAAQPSRARVFIIGFQSGSAEPLPDSQSEIAAAISYARDAMHPDVGVVGHADATGSPEINRTLSLQRAEVIRDALVRGGVDASRLRIESHGSSIPLVPTPPGIPEPRNRRVEITVR